MEMIEIARRLRAAAQELSKRCDGAEAKDGAGFNKVDTVFGQTIAQTPAEKWDENTVASVYRMIRKYRGQLDEYGIDFDEIEEPYVEDVWATDVSGRGSQRPEWWRAQGEESGEEDAATIEIGDPMGTGEKRIVVAFPYEEKLVERVRSEASGRRYRKSSGWLLHPNKTNATLALALIDEEDFECATETIKTLEELAEEGPEAEAERVMKGVWGSGETADKAAADGGSADGGSAPERTLEKVRVSFPYLRPVISEVKGRTQPRSFDGATKDWVVGVNERNALVLLEIASEYGFRFEEGVEEALAERAEGVRSEKQARWDPEAEVVRLLFPYDRTLISAVKEIPHASFVNMEEEKDGSGESGESGEGQGAGDSDRSGGSAWPTKHWKVPVSIEGAGELLSVIGSEGFQVEEDVFTAIEEEVEKRKRMHQLSEAQAGERLPVEDDLPNDLYEFQRAGVRYALEQKRVIIGDQMGLGKTIQAIATLLSAEAFPALIVCPAAVKAGWVKEIREWLRPEERGLSLSVLEGMDPDATGTTTFQTDDGEISVSVGEMSADIIVSNYAILSAYVDRLKERSFTGVVVDESHKVKNHKAQRTQNVHALAGAAEYRILLTGTAIRNRPSEYYEQLRILGMAGEAEDPLGDWFHFHRRYCDAKRTRFGWETDGASNIEELNEVMRANCYVRRLKEEVRGDLPDIQVQRVPVELSNRSEYERAKRDTMAYLSERIRSDEAFFEEMAESLGWPPSETSPGEVVIEKRKRLERNKTLVQIALLKVLAAEGKVEGILSWAQDTIEAGEKLVVFAESRSVQHALYDQLSETAGAERIFAEDATAKRNDAIQTFKEEEDCRAIVCSMGAASEGVDGLQHACSQVAFADFPWSPADLDQAIARLHRIGQEGDMVNVYHMTAEDTIDQSILRLIEEKRKVVTKATEGDGADLIESVAKMVDGATA